MLAVDADRPHPAILHEAAKVLRRGGLVAFPTETVYGLGANALDPEAVRRIFRAKGRPADNPVIAHVPDLDAARRLSSGWPELADRLGAAFWPGPLTLVVPRASNVPDEVTAGLDTVGVRVPAHPVALALLTAAGLPVAAPSANRFMEISPTTAQHVARALGDSVELILDGGPTGVGIESTVLDLSSGAPVLLRPGSIPLPQLEAVAGPIARGSAGGSGRPRRAPGMMARHYSPRADLRMFPPAARREAAELARAAADRGVTVGALLLEPLDAPIHHPVRMPQSPAAYARELYAVLHRLDELGCGLIIAEGVPETPVWAGIRDRLERASTTR